MKQDHHKKPGKNIAETLLPPKKRHAHFLKIFQRQSGPLGENVFPGMAVSSNGR